MTSLRAGNIVHLLDEKREIIRGADALPLLYQVISVYKDRGKAGLVSAYAEYAGLHPLKDIIYVSAGPLFCREDYHVGSTVIWIDNEDVYEGVIKDLYNSAALMTDVKKLMPIDYSVVVPYWKIPDGRRK